MVLLYTTYTLIATMMTVMMIKRSKHSASVISWPILRREVGGKQQNWFYRTNSGSLTSMTLSDVFTSSC